MVTPTSDSTITIPGLIEAGATEMRRADTWRGRALALGIVAAVQFVALGWLWSLWLVPGGAP